MTTGWTEHLEIIINRMYEYVLLEVCSCTSCVVSALRLSFTVTNPNPKITASLLDAAKLASAAINQCNKPVSYHADLYRNDAKLQNKMWACPLNSVQKALWL